MTIRSVADLPNLLSGYLPNELEGQGSDGIAYHRTKEEYNNEECFRFVCTGMYISVTRCQIAVMIMA